MTSSSNVRLWLELPDGSRVTPAAVSPTYIRLFERVELEPGTRCVVVIEIDEHAVRREATITHAIGDDKYAISYS